VNDVSFLPTGLPLLQAREGALGQLATMLKCGSTSSATSYFNAVPSTTATSLS